MLGFLKGKIEIKIDHFNFAPGDTISGTVVIKLKKPLKAREFNIFFIGEEKTTERDYEGDPNTRIRKIYEFKHPLDSEKEYPTSQDLTYSFEIKIPPNVLEQQKPPEGALGALAKVGKFMSGRRSQISWYLLARLDIPWGIDVKKKVQINLA